MSKSKLVGMEVPIFSFDSIKWLPVAVPSRDSTVTATEILLASPPTENFASCSAIGDPPQCFIWRIHKTTPNVMELLQFSAHGDCPNFGLRITFRDALFPSAHICPNQITPSHTSPYLLYALTVTGVGYLLWLRNVSAYSTRRSFTSEEVFEIALQNYSNNALVTSVAAAPGCLVLGRNDGSVSCFQLGLLDHSLPGFAHELCGDMGISRLWGFMSRNRVVAGVNDMAIMEIHGHKILLVLHSDGILAAWDLVHHNKILNQTTSSSNSQGATSMRLFVSDIDSEVIPMAILYGNASESSKEMICVYWLHVTSGDKFILSAKPSLQNITIDGVACCDIKFTLDKIWILTDSNLFFHKLLHENSDVGEAHGYGLLEELAAEMLFQNSDDSANILLRVALSIFSSAKNCIVPFLSSIFLHRLLHPGIFHKTILRSTMADYSKHNFETGLHSFTVEGLKKEISSVILNEAAINDPALIFSYWKDFCARYFVYWKRSNATCGLLVQINGGIVGLLRNNSVSLFRSLEHIEFLINGVSDEQSLEKYGSGLTCTNSEKEVVFELFQCMSNFRKQLGKTFSAIFLPLVVSSEFISCEEIVHHLMKVLESRCSPSAPCVNSLAQHEFGYEKAQANRNNPRRFALQMLLSLHSLLRKAGSWDAVLKALERYVRLIAPLEIIDGGDTKMPLNINACILIVAMSQIALVMLESALELLLFSCYLLNNGPRVNMGHDDINWLQLGLVPMIQNVVFEWITIYFLVATPTELTAKATFSLELSSLQIDDNIKRTWTDKLGRHDFTLACIILLGNEMAFQDQVFPSLMHLPCPQDITSTARIFASWIVGGRTAEESSSFLRHLTDIAVMLLRHDQFDAVESLLTIAEANMQGEKLYGSVQASDGYWCLLQHLLGCCYLAQAQYGFHGNLKDTKISEAIRCFFRASSGPGAPRALQSVSHGALFPQVSLVGSASSAVFKFIYFQWAMQIFEQHSISKGACEFALAALEQVDEALSEKDVSDGHAIFGESAIMIKGRLWANVFKFTLDLGHLFDAYCAMLSNPDEESKYTCLRRFIIVLFERGEIKVLCDGQLPLIGLADKIEQELASKASRSDIFAKPSPYKLLYAFEANRHNWRKAAGYMYCYSARLRSEIVSKDLRNTSSMIQERLSALSAAINALLLVCPSSVWLDTMIDSDCLPLGDYPNKKTKKSVKQQFFIAGDIHHQRSRFYVDIAKLENEFLLTSAEHVLSLSNVRWTFNEELSSLSVLIDLLVNANLFEMVFMVVLKFWKGSELKRELERIFSAMSLKCCPNKADFSYNRNATLFLTASMDETAIHGSPEMAHATQQTQENTPWETLEYYLEKFKGFHVGLPVTIAQTLLGADSHIELPLWLVNMFKDSQRDESRRMVIKQESNLNILFRLYVDFGRYSEAIKLFLEYTESYASMIPKELISRKRPFAACFPYHVAESLWCQLEKLIASGHQVDHWERLKNHFLAALSSHLKLLKTDSEDALACAAC